MPKSFLNSLKQRIYRFKMKRKGVVIYNNTIVFGTKFRGKATIEPYCRMVGAPTIVVGNNFYLNSYCHLAGEIDIGDDVMVGPKTVMWARNHGMALNGTPMNTQPSEERLIKIGHDVWIGAHVTILMGVTVGNGAVIGAGAVVTKDVPENAVVAGNPARILKYRE